MDTGRGCQGTKEAEVSKETKGNNETKGERLMRNMWKKVQDAAGEKWYGFLVGVAEVALWLDVKATRCRRHRRNLCNRLRGIFGRT